MAITGALVGADCREAVLLLGMGKASISDQASAATAPDVLFR